MKSGCERTARRNRSSKKLCFPFRFLVALHLFSPLEASLGPLPRREAHKIKMKIMKIMKESTKRYQPGVKGPACGCEQAKSKQQSLSEGASLLTYVATPCQKNCTGALSSHSKPPTECRLSRNDFQVIDLQQLFKVQAGEGRL